MCPTLVRADPDAYNAWRRVVTKLDEIGLLTPLDSEVLGQYALIRGIEARTSRAIAEVRREYAGDDVMIDKLSAKMVRRLLTCRREAKDIEARYGFTPSDRARLVLPSDRAAAEPTASPAEKYFRKIG